MKDHATPDTMTETGTAGINRRGFMVSMIGAGGALVIGTMRAEAGHTDVTPWGKPLTEGAQEFTPWLNIAPDGIVTVYVTAPDIGNGTLTQALSFVYEELSPRWEDLKAEYASTNTNHKLQNFFGNVGGPLGYFSGRSTGLPRSEAYMSAAAGARERLKAAAGEAWGVDASEITVAEGVLTHAGSNNSAPFTEFLAAAAAVTLAAEPAIKTREQFTHLEKASPPKVQIPQITTGKAVYGMDVQVPGKVYAALRQSPVHGGRVVSYDFEAIRNMPGVRAVVEVQPTDLAEPNLVEPPFPFGVGPVQSAIAVIADHYWQARTALDALPVVWDDGPGAKWVDTQMMNDAAMAALDSTDGTVELSVGDVQAEFAKGGTIIESEFLTPYCEQMPMEPLNGTALVTEDRVDLWHPSQHTQQAWSVAVQQTGVNPENVEAHQTFVGGGFGRRIFSDDARTVVAVAQQYPGVPVHTVWSREEATRQGRYRPLMAARLKARLGDDGYPTALEVHQSGGPGLFVSMHTWAGPLVMENVHMETHVVPDFHVLTGPYRGPGYNSEIFFIESFLDELAEAAGIDPLDYRVGIFSRWSDPGWVKILEDLRVKSNWGSPLPAGQARGVAIGNWGMGGRPAHGTTCGCVVHAEVSPGGEVKIHDIFVSFDTGRVYNRDAVQVELEGGTFFGLNMALNEGLNIANGRIVEGNYDEYPMLRMGDVPPVHVSFDGLTDLERHDEIGEPPVGPVGPALANAIYMITGKRMRTQPFREHDLSWGGAA